MKKQLNMFLNIHMMGYYAAIKKNKATIKQTDMEQSLRYTGKKKKARYRTAITVCYHCVKNKQAYKYLFLSARKVS